VLTRKEVLEVTQTHIHIHKGSVRRSCEYCTEPWSSARAAAHVWNVTFLHTSNCGTKVTDRVQGGFVSLRMRRCCAWRWTACREGPETNEAWRWMWCSGVVACWRERFCTSSRARAPFGRRSSMSSVLKLRVLHAVVWVVAEAVRSRRLSISSCGRLATGDRSERVLTMNSERRTGRFF
jgi:hypothetical protein